MFKTLETFDTEFSADSVEWCPAKNFEDIFVCGTYQLAPEDDENEKKKRVGRIYLFQIVNNEKSPQLKLLQKLDVPAVLDMKWAHVKISNKVLLGVVNSIGYLQIYELTGDHDVSLQILSETSVEDESTLALSLDWSTGKRDQDYEGDAKITVSDSHGSISLFILAENGGKIEKIKSWHAHDFEAWITAFDYWDTNIVYTGGDDCKFLRFDTRTDAGPINTIRCHNAGVTSLHSCWKKEFHLVSGSYDENLRTWDTRNFRRPVAELNLSGGIWRLKWDPYKSRYLFAACMYNGFSIVDCEDFNDPKIITDYKEHESIAYGCDWSFKNADFPVVATCSFYDHCLKLSTVELEGLENFA